MHLHRVGFGLMFCSAVFKVLNILFLNLCFVVKSDGTVKPGINRRNLGSRVCKPLWSMHTGFRSTGAVHSKQTEQSQVSGCHRALGD